MQHESFALREAISPSSVFKALVVLRDTLQGPYTRRTEPSRSRSLFRHRTLDNAR